MSPGIENCLLGVTIPRLRILLYSLLQFTRYSDYGGKGDAINEFYTVRNPIGKMTYFVSANIMQEREKKKLEKTSEAYQAIAVYGTYFGPDEYIV